MYIAPLQDTYSEALPTQAKRKRTGPFLCLFPGWPVKSRCYYFIVNKFERKLNGRTNQDWAVKSPRQRGCERYIKRQREKHTDRQSETRKHLADAREYIIGQFELHYQLNACSITISILQTGRCYSFPSGQLFQPTSQPTRQSTNHSFGQTANQPNNKLNQIKLN